MWSPSKAAALRAAKRKPSIYPTIDLLPFLSIFLVFLFMFMCTVPMHVRGSPVDLPNARTAAPQSGALREDAMHLAVTRDGRYFFGGQQVERGNLHNLIQSAGRNGSEPKIYLSADARVKNDTVNIAIEQIRLAGITNIAIIANKPATQ